MAHSDVIKIICQSNNKLNSEETAKAVSSPYITLMVHHCNRYKMIKKLLITPIFSLCLMGVSCVHKVNNEKSFQNKSGICFLDTIHDFGTIPMDVPVDSFDFRFVNILDHPIVILSAKTSCECTSATYPHIPVMPDDTSYIRVKYNGNGREAEYFNKSVKVTSSASDIDVMLEITGELK